jgi:hypothetical protein
LDAQSPPLTAADLRTKVSAYQSLGRSDDAVRTYRDILQKRCMGKCLYTFFAAPDVRK